jgi:hypothetical protein
MDYREDLQCQICQKWGHSTIKCYRHFDISVTTSVITSQPQQALIAESSASSPSEAWFLDSRATTHVTSDINCLTTQQPYSGSDKVFLGNGSGLCISHIGTTSI